MVNGSLVVWCLVVVCRFVGRGLVEWGCVASECSLLKNTRMSFCLCFRSTWNYFWACRKAGRMLMYQFSSCRVDCFSLSVSGRGKKGVGRCNSHPTGVHILLSLELWLFVVV